MFNFLYGPGLITLIKTAGYFGIFFIVFAESGLLVGFFLPGDSLLFTAGFLASQGYLSILPLSLICFIAAVLGDNFGFAFGRKMGPKIFNKEESFFFHKDYVGHAQAFYEKNGPKAIMLARFMPIFRTFAPILAGVGKMNYKIFFFYNILGGAIWALGMTWLGYFLGNSIPNIDKYMLPVVLAIIIISSAPSIFHLWRIKKKR